MDFTLQYLVKADNSSKPLGLCNGAVKIIPGREELYPLEIGKYNQNMESETNPRIKKLEKLFSVQSDLYLVMVYGSTASGDFGPESDVDLAVAGKGPLSSSRLAEISLEIEKELGVPGDVIDLAKAEGLILYQAMTYGVPIKNMGEYRYKYLTKAIGLYEDFLPQLRELQKEKIRRFAKHEN